MITDETELIIPDYDPYNPKPYPGDIKPGTYSKPRSRSCLKSTRTTQKPSRFLRDMMEEMR